MSRSLCQFLVVFLSYLISDVIAAIHIKALVSNSFMTAVATIVFLHFVTFFAQAWWVDHRDTRKRLLLTVAAGLGAGVGTTLVLLCMA